MVRINDGMIKNLESARMPIEMTTQSIDSDSILRLANTPSGRKSAQQHVHLLRPSQTGGLIT